MAKRAKSEQDIKEQRNRILARMGLHAESGPSAAEQGYRFDYDRAKRVADKASDYLKNIRRTHTYQNDGSYASKRKYKNYQTAGNARATG